MNYFFFRNSKMAMIKLTTAVTVRIEPLLWFFARLRKLRIENRLRLLRRLQLYIRSYKKDYDVCLEESSHKTKNKISFGGLELLALSSSLRVKLNVASYGSQHNVPFELETVGFLNSELPDFRVTASMNDSKNLNFFLKSINGVKNCV